MSRLTVNWPTVDNINTENKRVPFKRYFNIGTFDKKLPLTNSIILDDSDIPSCDTDFGLNNSNSNPFNIRLSHITTFDSIQSDTYIFDKSELKLDEDKVYDIIITAYEKCTCVNCNNLRNITNIPFIEIATAISEGASSYTYTLYE